jgi:hypothetical protein
MFELNCPACQKRQLIFESQITGIVNDASGIHVEVTCWCGAQATIETGSTLQAA